MGIRQNRPISSGPKLNVKLPCLLAAHYTRRFYVLQDTSLFSSSVYPIENTQKTSLKIILQDQYTGYEAACQLTGLSSLVQRRESRSLTFARRCLDNPEMSRFFPRNTELPQQELRDRDAFKVNFSRTSNYQKSAIVHCQMQLNQFFHQQNDKKKADEKEKEERWREWMSQLDERLRRRREGPGGREEGG